MEPGKPQPPRVLLVEDEPAVGDALIDCLEQIGCTVVSVPTLSGAAALARDDSEVFDVAILDLELPDGNGLELVAALRSRSAPCVALVLTAHEESEWGRRAAAVGVAGFLRKPVSARRLSAEVAQATARSREMRTWAIKQGDGAASEARGGGEQIVAAAVVADLDSVDPEAERTAGDQIRLLADEFGLTARQAEALEQVSAGHRDRQIAESMGVSYSRVRQLLAAGFGKLGVKSRNDFIRFLCERQGIR